MRPNDGLGMAGNLRSGLPTRPHRKVNIASLKRFARARLPKRSEFREVLLAEPDPETAHRCCHGIVAPKVSQMLSQMDMVMGWDGCWTS